MVDVVIRPLDDLVLTPYVYPEWLLPTDVKRQIITVYFTLLVGGALLYFIVAGFDWTFLFDKDVLHHPKILKNQVSMEIKAALWAIVIIPIYTTPFIIAEMNGFSKLYDDFNSRSLKYTFGSIAAFLAWNDFWVYLIHRGLHDVPFLYKHVHKLHHKPIIPTPWAALCFTPLDGFLQSLPYHAFVFVVPIHKVVYLASFVAVQVWTVIIHDHYFVLPKFLDPYLNGAAHHSDHHAYFNYNHGLYTTIMDRLGGTHREPKYEPCVTIDRMRAEGLIPTNKGVEIVDLNKKVT